MKRNPDQPGLFDALEFPLLLAEQADDARSDSHGCDCAACTGTKLEVICEKTGAHPDCPTDRLGNHCTLDGMPARIIGRSFHYATIEPLDIEADPIRCCWDVVTNVLEECDRAFVRDDDDTDE